jgi:DNA-binding NtrC family response regulator
MSARSVVLLVVREGGDAAGLAAALRAAGHDVVRTHDDASALNALDDAHPDALVAEWKAPRLDGRALAARALALDPTRCVLLVTADAPAEAVAAALRDGVHDVLARPVRRAALVAALERGLAHRRLARRAERLQSRLDARHDLDSLVARSGAMRRVAEQVRHVAPSRVPVLLEGERGTGRRRVAQALHHLGPRRAGPFVTLDCGALPEALAERELFGVERGVDESGARRGQLETADGGTLLLLDVDGLPASLQVRLLRVLRDRAYERVGGGDTLRADVRVVATSVDGLASAVAAGRFRADLQQRLAAVRIALPPLRERREDIPELVDAFVREADRAFRRRVTGMSRGALERLAAAEWPGQVAELKSVVERMVEGARGRRALTFSDLPARLRPDEGGGARLGVVVGMTLDEAERHLITATLARVDGDKVRAAAMLGIGLRTLYRKLARYDER